MTGLVLYKSEIPETVYTRIFVNFLREQNKLRLPRYAKDKKESGSLRSLLHAE